ncbi:hypothetical protein EVAR_3289_1 [Eumeta japonica]|uniref:RNase H type-1 domain-containing protein n=1 Tax=Eumeta variegata TaxID=151549 RepID=A0A4C1SXQ8_EUMVA|nr:hypothetical protein EVAR_3289_1 [Eumeta japonica]
MIWHSKHSAISLLLRCQWLNGHKGTPADVEKHTDAHESNALEQAPRRFMLLKSTTILTTSPPQACTYQRAPRRRRQRSTLKALVIAAAATARRRRHPYTADTDKPPTVAGFHQYNAFRHSARLLGPTLTFSEVRGYLFYIRGVPDICHGTIPPHPLWPLLRFLCVRRSPRY